MHVNFPYILHEFFFFFFYFTHLFFQNTHINLSILHIYSIKYSFFYNIYYFLTHYLSLFHRPNHHHHHHHHSITPHLATIITHPTNIIKENQAIQAETHSIRNPFNSKPIQSESQIITHPSQSPLIKQQEINGKRRSVI